MPGRRKAPVGADQVGLFDEDAGGEVEESPAAQDAAANGAPTRKRATKAAPKEKPPRKKAQASSGSDAAERIAPADASEAVADRPKRTTPRRKAADSSAPETAVPVADAPPKRTAARRKVATSATADAPETSAPHAENPPKRKAPRRKSTPSSAADASAEPDRKALTEDAPKRTAPRRKATDKPSQEHGPAAKAPRKKAAKPADIPAEIPVMDAPVDIPAATDAPAALSAFSVPEPQVLPAARPLSPDAGPSAPFLPIYQGAPTNALGKIVGRGIETGHRTIFGDMTIHQDQLTLFIEHYSQLTSGLKNSTVKLLQAGVLQLTTQNSYRGETADTIKHEVAFTLTDFMRLRGLKDRKEARRQLHEDCEALLAMTFQWSEKRGRDVLAFQMVKPLYAAGLSRGGMISLSFSPEFALYLISAYEMKLPRLYFSLNDRRNPNSSPLLWKLSLMKKLNRGKPSEDIVSVRTLLDNAPFLPRYEELPKGHERVKERIIEPLERDLDALAPVLSWAYCGPRGVPMPEDTPSPMPYRVFIAAYVRVTWIDYPQLGPNPGATRPRGPGTPKQRRYTRG